MLRNYWRIALRNLLKHKGFSFINLTGLTVAFTCCLLMFMYIRHELSFDRFQEKGNRIVRVIMEYGFGNSDKVAGNFTSTKVMPSFRRNFPEVEEGVRMTSGSGILKIGDQLFEDPEFLFADSTFFQVFSSFTLQAGSPENVLGAPNQLVLTASAAKKYFPHQNAVGQTILVGSQQTPYIVTGIADDCPTNSQIRFSMLGSFSSLGAAQEETYWNANYQTYLLLKENTSLPDLQAKIRPFMEKEMNDPNVWLTYFLEPYFDVHLHSPYTAYVANTDIRYIYIASGMAILILLIACFTYINMSTARSLERAREVGIRKVAGASRQQVFSQFIGESLVISIVALLISFAVTGLLLPLFNTLVDRELSLTELTHPLLLFSAFCMVLFIALLAGSYPALVLSGFQPIKVLKGNFRNSGSGHWVRQSLTVFQFTISAFLLIGSFVMFRQVKYIQKKSLGFNRDHVIIIKGDYKVGEKMDLLRNQWKANAQVKNASLTYNPPISIMGGYGMRSASMPSTVSLNVYANPIDEEFLKTNEIQLIAGSDISGQDVLDASHEESEKNFFHFILNESAAKELGWNPQQAIGQRMYLDESRPGIVKGVVRDFHFSSLHSPIQSLVLFPSSFGNTILVKVSGEQLPETVAFMEKTWKGIIQHRPFSYSFMDEAYNSMYKAEQQTAQVIGIFTGVAILLACVGLLGLSAFSVQQRTKEIGVRKVLGASVQGIVWMLATYFLRMVLVASIIAAPIGWFATNKWLEDFSYRTSLDFTVFIWPVLGLSLLALIVISIQTIRAAVLNPVKSLRSE
ncbi:MAG: ABC transporter permease [Flavipsychrobacter sp.]|nr:ABC transporter permease [Flavipsychrobacter sp.]